VRRRNNLGQAEGIALVGVAAANAGINAAHAAKVSKIQKRQGSKLDADELAMTYVRNLVHRIETLGTRLARTSGRRPGTAEFEELLKEALSSDMNYQGNCNADIYVPPTSTSKVGEPRTIWGKINRTGFLEQPSRLPPDVGPIWATGCKNAQDKFRIASIEAFKGTQKFKHIKTTKSDIGTVGLFVTFGAGLFLLIVFIMSIKMQTAVIKEQRRADRAARKAKAPTAPKPKRKSR
jgi:hypothetical protein